MAGLYQKGETGIYAVQFYDAARSPRRKRVTTATRIAKAAERLRRFWEAEYAVCRSPWTDAPPVPGAPSRPRAAAATLADARRQFLASRAHRALNTRFNYERVTGWFVDHVGGDRPATSVTPADVPGWLAGLDVRPVTKANYLRHLRAFFRYGVASGLLADDPTDGVGVERVPRTFPKAMSAADAERLVAAAGALPRSGWWLGPLVQLALWTALRRAELTHLRWADVDLGARRLVVACADGFTSKSGAERVVPLSDGACDVLRQHRAESRRRLASPARVFEHERGPVALSTLTHAVSRAAEAAGVRATVHGLRHTAITRLVERGVPVPVVQRVAGHGSVDVTMRYVHVGADVYADEVRRAFDR